MIESKNELAPEARQHLHLFRKCLPMRVKLHEVLRVLGNTEGQVCLDIGTSNPMISYHLRRRGGEWHSIVTDGKMGDSVRTVVKDNVYEFDGQTLPFENKTFDAVVVLDFLERIESDDSFIVECHRVLKADGRLIVNVARAKAWTLIRPLQALLGLTYEKKGLVRPGYSESQLFSVLKHGFDVYQVRSHSRLFVELTDTVAQAVMARITRGEEHDTERVLRFHSVVNVFYQLAFQLDILLFFSRGHYLVAGAKRRAWHPRKAPVLIDGRSISEAVLSRAGS